MDRQKAKIIGSVFLNKEPFESYDEDAIKYYKKQLNLSTKYKKINHDGVGNLTSTVLEALKDKVREDRRNLDEARKVAKKWFDDYMYFKKMIMYYPNEHDRRKFNNLKYFHKDSAVGVKIRKSQLKQDEVLLNKFSEYLNLTKKIKMI